MSLDEEDKQIIDMLDKKDREHVLNLNSEVGALYEVLAHLEAIKTDMESISIDEKDKKSLREIKFRLYNRLDLLEDEISSILKSFWKGIIRAERKKHKLIYKKFNL